MKKKSLLTLKNTRRYATARERLRTFADVCERLRTFANAANARERSVRRSFCAVTNGQNSRLITKSNL